MPQPSTDQSLECKIQLLRQQCHSLQEHNHSLQEQNHLLNEQLEWLKRQVFGQKKETAPPPNEQQLLLDGFGSLEKPEPEERAISSHKRRKPRQGSSDKISIPDDLPIEKTVIDIPEDQKYCPNTGKALVKIGEDVSSKLAHKPGSFYIKQVIRPKYALSEGAGVLSADLPDSLLNRCSADESLLAEVLVNKFSDHLPLYRLEEILKRSKVEIPRQVLSQWVIKSTEALRPLYDELHRAILDSRTLFIDESPVSMLAPGKGKVHESYMWVVSNGALCSFAFRANRKHKNAEDLLKGFQGVFHSDKYGAYEELAKQPTLTWCPCWAHIRRKFFEAQSGDPEFRNWILRKIRYLFMYERVALSRPPDERLHIRQQKEAPIIDEIVAACKKRLHEGRLLPKSNLRKALGYLCGLIPYLKSYTLFADARLDNNHAERVIRPLAIGRKNWMFVGSGRGGEAAAVALSLIQSCRSLGINPRVYLEDIMRRIQGHPINKLRELLPDRWAKSS